MASLVFLHGGDVCPLESQVAVVLEFSGASVCGERQLEKDVSFKLTRLGEVGKENGGWGTHHADWQDQDGKHLDGWGHGALCQPLEEPRSRAGDLLKHCWCGTHIGGLG